MIGPNHLLSLSWVGDIENGGRSLSRRTIDARCPSCDSEVILRLPKGVEDGTFEVNCRECSEIIELDLRLLPNGNERIRINGVPFRRTGKIPKPKLEEVQVKAPKVEIIQEKTVNFDRRLRIVMVLFLIIAVLGFASSIATITSSFSIRDLEERSENDVSTFSVWVLDSETGRPIQDAEVYLSSDEFNRSGTTDIEGLVIFERVATGSLDIRLNADGYKTTSGDIVVMKGSPNVIDIPMERGDPGETVPMLTKQFESEDYSASYTNIMAAIMFMSSITAAAGAYLVSKKELYGLTVILGFLSIFSFGFLIGSLLSTVVIVVLIVSYKGFSHNYNLRMLLESQGREDLKDLFRPSRAKVMGLPPADDD